MCLNPPQVLWTTCRREQGKKHQQLADSSWLPSTPFATSLELSPIVQGSDMEQKKISALYLLAFSNQLCIWQKMIVLSPQTRYTWLPE